MLNLWPLLGIIIIAIFLSTNKVTSNLMTLKLYIEEESPPEKFIGDLRKELTSTFDPQVLSKVETFTFLARPFQQLDSFNIDSSSILRTTSMPLDREQHCPQNFIPSHASSYDNDGGGGGGGDDEDDEDVRRRSKTPFSQQASEECILEMDVGLGNKTNFAMVVITLKIVIIDVNDNPPSFPQDVYHVTFMENSPPGVKTSLPLAIDRDTQRFGVKGYRLQGQSTRLFELHLEKEMTTVVPYLVVLHKLRYHVDPYLLTLEAFDGGSPQLVGGVTLSITIEDENDHAPQFSSPRPTVTLREDQAVNTVVYKANATDADHGINAEIQYALASPSRNYYPTVEGDSPFRIDRHTGRLYLKRALDYETEKWYKVTILAVDQGRQPQTGQMVLEVKVEDVNDNPPMIKLNTIGSSSSSSPSSSSRPLTPNDPHQVEVEENTPPGTFVAHISVFDVDTGPNGHVKCRQESSEKNFRLNDLISGQHTITTLMYPDHETVKSYLIRIICFDQGQPSLTSDNEIQVSVVDVNDNSPVFAEKSYNVSVAENNNPEAYVMQVRATDRDSGNNSKLIYTILEPSISSRLFSIHPDTGVIKATSVLDHEMNKSVSFTVRASDCGQPPLQSDVKVNLMIQDINDQEPAFIDSPYEFQIRENNQPGSLVGFVSAIDGDSHPYNQFIYKIIPDETSKDDLDALSSFSIDPKSGKVMAKTALDREKRSKFKFILAAVDQDRPALSSTVEVVVKILDENDNRPRIRLYNTSKNTDYSEGHDLLSGPTLSTPQRNNHHHHHHNHYQQPLGNHHHHHHHHQQNPIDGSDEIIELSSFHISSFVPVGYDVATFSATDDDEGSNAQITFSMVVLDLHDSIYYPAMSPSHHHSPITPSSPPLAHQLDDGARASTTPSKIQAFVIDSLTGRLSTGLDFSSYNLRRYRLLITAQDGGDPPSGSTLRLTLVVDPNVPYYDEDYGSTKGFLRNLATRHGSVLVLGVIAISTVVGLLLIIAIIIVKLRDRRGVGHLRHTDAYHCRIQEQKAMDKANGYGPTGSKSAFRQLADEDKSLSLNQELNNRSCVSPNSNNTMSTQGTLNKRNMLNSQNHNRGGESVITRQKIYNTPQVTGPGERNCVKESMNSLTDESNDSGLPASYEDATLKKNGVSWKLVDLRNDSNDTLDRGSSGVNSPTYCRTYYHHTPQPPTSNFDPLKPMSVEITPLKEPLVQPLPPPPASMLLSIDETECQCRQGESCCEDNCRFQQEQHRYLQQQHYIQQQQQQQNKWTGPQRNHFVVDPSPPQYNDYNKLVSNSPSFYGEQDTLPLRNPQLKEVNFYIKGESPQEDQRIKQPVAQVRPQIQQKQTFATFLGSSPTKQVFEAPHSTEEWGYQPRLNNSSRPQTPGFREIGGSSLHEMKNISSILPAHNSALMEKLKQNSMARLHGTNNRA